MVVKPMPNGRVLARHVESIPSKDAQAFLDGGGERGPQISVIPNGHYRINPRLFSVKAVNVVDVPENMVGVVTTREGAPLNTGEIAGEKLRITICSRMVRHLLMPVATKVCKNSDFGGSLLH